MPYGALKRLEIARALAMKPRVIFLDGPPPASTPKETIGWTTWCARWPTRASPWSLVEHDMKMVMNLSDRILVLDYGKKLAEGTGEEIRRNPDVIAPTWAPTPETEEEQDGSTPHHQGRAPQPVAHRHHRRPGHRRHGGRGKWTQAFLGSVFDYFEQFVDDRHHPKGDDYLFRLLRQRSPADAAAVLDRLEADHRDAPATSRPCATCSPWRRRGRLPVADLARGPARLPRRPPKSTSASKRKSLPLATAALTAADWQEIDAAFLDNADPVFGTQAQAGFRELFHRVASLAPPSVGLGAHSGGELLPARPAAKCC